MCVASWDRWKINLTFKVSLANRHRGNIEKYHPPFSVMALTECRKARTGYCCLSKSSAGRALQSRLSVFSMSLMCQFSSSWRLAAATSFHLTVWRCLRLKMAANFSKFGVRIIVSWRFAQPHACFAIEPQSAWIVKKLISKKSQTTWHSEAHERAWR